MRPTALPACTVQVGHREFVLDAQPDPFDERDLPYRPLLEPLPAAMDERPETRRRMILQQEGESCVGHALASMIGVVLTRAAEVDAATRPDAPPPRPVLVSPYMLYRLARRYDEFTGEADIGSSLRGGLKGWFHHGVCELDRWSMLRMAQEPDFEDELFRRHCRERPLGAFYRVQTQHLDHLQSAIRELHAVAVACAIHEGWTRPRVVQRGTRTLHVIERTSTSRTLGNHAVVLAGYNDLGFLVQNSWGTGWGRGGFATLPYEDWLVSAFDAWVARPGVPQTPTSVGERRLVASTGTGLVFEHQRERRRLRHHVVKLGPDGRLSSRGHLVSGPRQVESLFQTMDRTHRQWLAGGRASARHVVVYAPRGPATELETLDIAEKHLDWWLANGVYPVNLFTYSQPLEKIHDEIRLRLAERAPSLAQRPDLQEQGDRLVERFARDILAWGWHAKKQAAQRAAAALPRGTAIPWGSAASADLDAVSRLPGGSLLMHRLALYARRHRDVKVHLLGHGTGALLLAPLLARLAEAGATPASVHLLAPTLTHDELRRQVLPHVERGRPAGLFLLNDAEEAADACRTGSRTVYHKSLLYLVSRGLEAAIAGGYEAPIAGMERFLDHATGHGGGPLRRHLQDAGWHVIVSPACSHPWDCCEARTHHGFDEDAATLTSVLLRMLGEVEPRKRRFSVPRASTPGLSTVEVIADYAEGCCEQPAAE
ncbi:MAG TPA: C1 family peptidase [Thermoanaerobaculia bacterium]|nr:C1 family peptidase [Thermoanaerobaculia bacterium]